TGILSLLAARYGARRVYAIEPSNAVFLAQQAACANGYGGRIECIQALSTETSIPEKVDVVVSDLRGVLPFFQHHIPSIVHARSQFLRSGGNLIPKSDVVWGAIVEAPQQYDDLVKPWRKFGFNMEAAQHLVTNTWSKAKVSPEQMLSRPEVWST